MGVNLGGWDRAVRVVLGIALAVAGVSVALASRVPLGIVGGVVLALAGAVLVFSGTVGFCHVYHVLGVRTAKRD